MSALTIPPATESGIACGSCSRGRDQVRHASVRDIARCSAARRAGARPVVPVVTSVVEFVPAPVVEAPAPVKPAAGEIWELGGRIFKVVPARNSDRLFAHELLNDLDDVEVGDRFAWQYRGLASRVLAGGRLATAEVAARIGKVFGRCVFCGRLLTDDKAGRSVEVGYGPVCAEQRGLPWG